MDEKDKNINNLNKEIADKNKTIEKLNQEVLNLKGRAVPSPTMPEKCSSKYETVRTSNKVLSKKSFGDQILNIEMNKSKIQKDDKQRVHSSSVFSKLNEKFRPYTSNSSLSKITTKFSKLLQRFNHPVNSIPCDSNVLKFFNKTPEFMKENNPYFIELLKDKFDKKCTEVSSLYKKINNMKKKMLLMSSPQKSKSRNYFKSATKYASTTKDPSLTKTEYFHKLVSSYNS